MENYHRARDSFRDKLRTLGVCESRLAYAADDGFTDPATQSLFVGTLIPIESHAVSISVPDTVNQKLLEEIEAAFLKAGLWLDGTQMMDIPKRIAALTEHKPRFALVFDDGRVVYVQDEEIAKLGAIAAKRFRAVRMPASDAFYEYTRLHFPELWAAICTGAFDVPKA